MPVPLGVPVSVKTDLWWYSTVYSCQGVKLAENSPKLFHSVQQTFGSTGIGEDIAETKAWSDLKDHVDVISKTYVAAPG